MTNQTGVIFCHLRLLRVQNKHELSHYIIAVLYLSGQYFCISRLSTLKVPGFAFGICFPSIWHILEQKSRYSEIISQIQRIKKRVIFHYRFRRFSTNKEFFIKKRIDTQPDHFINFCKLPVKSGLSRHKKIPTAKGRY